MTRFIASHSLEIVTDYISNIQIQTFHHLPAPSANYKANHKTISLANVKRLRRLEIMVRLLQNIRRDEQFHTPGGLDLMQGVTALIDDTTKVLTDAQLLTLTLNEICVQIGRGQFLWYPEEAHNVKLLFRSNKPQTCAVLTDITGQWASRYALRRPETVDR